MTHTPEPVAGLSPRQLDRAFPFHWRVDADLRLLQMGEVLRRRFPHAGSGTPLSSVFRVARPRMEKLDHAALGATGEGIVLVETLCASPLRLRGQILPCDTGSGDLLFIGSPWLTRLAELESQSLTLQDFAAHDSIMDFLFVHQASQAALEDTRLLARTLKERSQRLDTIFQLSPDGFVAFDEFGKVDYVNPAFQHMTGLDLGALAGKTEAQVDGLLGALCDTPAAASNANDDTARRRERRAERRAAPRRMLQLMRPRRRTVQRSLRRGEGKAKVLYLRDVTRETEVDRMKSEFLTTAAHELRTPMASVYGFTELLLNRPFDDATRKDVLRTVHRQAGALIHMLNELLDLARIEARAGKDFHIETRALRPLIQETLAALLIPGDERKVRVSLPDILPDVNVDAAKFRQALTNLLSNAYKYSPQGGDIEIDVISRQDGRALGVRVSDRGIGMTAEQLGRAFERFYRADASGNLPGTGLGLSLVKEIMELMGGHVELHSQPGAGTQAILWLSLRGVRRKGGTPVETTPNLMEQP